MMPQMQILLCLLLAGYSCAQTSGRAREELSSLLDPTQHKCQNIDSTHYAVMPGVTILSIDTVCHKSIPTIEWSPVRYAVDEQRRVYRLMTRDTTEFSLMLKDHISSLSPSLAYEVGKMYIETSLLSTRDPFHYVQFFEEFIKLNKRLMFEQLQDLPPKAWEEVEMPLRNLPLDTNCSYVRYDLYTSCYIVDFYVWLEEDGTYRNITLSINKYNDVYVQADSVLASGVGWYRKFRY